MAAFARIFIVPVLIDSAGNAHQPVTIFREFQKFVRGKKLDTVRRWIAERFEQPRSDERRHIMRLAIQHPRRLLRRQARRQLAEQPQKLLLVFSHPSNQGIGVLQAIPSAPPQPPALRAGGLRQGLPGPIIFSPAAIVRRFIGQTSADCQPSVLCPTS